ncbi:hypothetical protein MCAV_02190 [[Mycoplasma] cavipharyngis]|uniref:hypothetical protein n=1 Tax=[Mycoplasma] cavipharyngis TaxID=92757 RepID=UPI003704B33E
MIDFLIAASENKTASNSPSTSQTLFFIGFILVIVGVVSFFKWRKRFKNLPFQTLNANDLKTKNNWKIASISILVIGLVLIIIGISLFTPSDIPLKINIFNYEPMKTKN